MGAGEDRFMKAASASSLNAGEIAALGVESNESRAAALPSEAILVLRGLLIGTVLLLISAVGGVAFASLLFRYPIGRLA